MKLKKIMLILACNVLFAFGAAYFLLPSGMISGGLTGLGMALENGFGIPTDATVWVLSIALFLLGFLLVGKEFALTTLVGSFAYPTFFSLATRISQMTGYLTEDPFLCLALGGVTFGVGIGGILRQGASTGGTDIVAVVLNKKLGLPLSATLYVVDALVLVTQVFFVDSTEKILYGLLFVLLYSLVLDMVLTADKSRLQLQIITPCYEAVNRMILEKFDRGSTLFRTEGGYTRKESYMVQTVISKRELFRLREEVLRLDPSAFLVVNQVSEVNGRGFTLEKIARGE